MQCGCSPPIGEDARVVAGGHSLIPMMKLRMAQLEHLIDLQGLTELQGIRLEGGGITLGALTTQAAISASGRTSQGLPDPQGDRAADRRPAGAGGWHGRRQRRRWRSRQRHAGGDDGLGATYHASARIAGGGFLRGTSTRAPILHRAQEPGEIVTAIRIPAPTAGHGYAYEKLKRKIGDYATAAAAVVLTPRVGPWRAVRSASPMSPRRPFRRRCRPHPHRLPWRERSSMPRRRRRRSDHGAGLRWPRRRRLPHQDGRRDGARALERASSRALSPRSEAQNPDRDDGERQGRRGAGGAAPAADPFPARAAEPDRPAHRLRDEPLRRLHDRPRRQVSEGLHHLCRPGRWRQNRDDRRNRGGRRHAARP